MAVPEAAEAWAESARPMMIAAEACVVNARFLDGHFDELDPVVSHRMLAGRTARAPDYFAMLRRSAALRERVWRRWPTSTPCWCRPRRTPPGRSR